MMKYALAIVAALLLTSSANAQCTGQFASGQACGNSGSTNKPPTGTTLSPLFDAAFGAPSARGTMLNRGASTWSATIAPVLGNPGTTTGTLGLASATGGTQTITPPAVAGATALQLPSLSGTVPSTATVPIVLNATTGVLTCPTCVTSSGGGAITGTAPISVSGAGVVSIDAPYTTLTASNGGIVYSGAANLAILSGTATARQMLQSGASAAPAWSTTTWPATTTINRILYSSAANVIGEISTVNGGVLNANASGVPALTVTPVLGVPGTSTGTLGFAGITSGTATITPQAVAGTPTLTLPNTSGTFAVVASTPLVLSATTGTLTCPTCVTSSGGGAITGTAPISVSGGGVVSLDDAGVTYAKIQNLGALAVMGRATNSSGVGANISATAASDAVLRESGSTIGFGTIATGGIANNAVTLAKLATQATNTVLGNATSGTAVPTALAVSSCSTAASALNWTTNTGFGCNTSITAAAVPIGGITGLGTGVATALAVNVGTAGSFVVNGGALGSPSSAGTLPTFTLGGTISGGGNQINNVIIGTSTPLAGFFTTLSATTSVTSPVIYGGSAVGSQLVLTSTSNGAPSGDSIRLTGSKVLYGAAAAQTMGATGGINPTWQTYAAAGAGSFGVIRETTPGGGGALFVGGSSRSTPSTGSYSALQAGDGLISLIGVGDTGASLNAQGAAMVMTAEAVWTATSSAGRISFSTTPAGATNYTERLRIDSVGHFTTYGTAPALTVCGTTPAISGNDIDGEVTMGTGSPTGCVITFASAYAAAPKCVVTWQANLAAMGYTISTTAITLTQTGTSSNKVNYSCRATG